MVRFGGERPSSVEHRRRHGATVPDLPLLVRPSNRRAHRPRSRRPRRRRWRRCCRRPARSPCAGSAAGSRREDKGGDSGYDPVTIADRNIEDALRAGITAAYPDHEVVGEEAGSSGPPGRYRWLIDPIDGTKAFVTGSPLWGTLLGLLDDGRPVAGWIHQPYLEETFVGIAGRGAWMERRGYASPAAHTPRRQARRRRRLLHDAVDVHRSRRAGAVRGGQRSGPASCATAATATPTPSWRWATSTSSSTPACSPTTSSPRWRSSKRPAASCVGGGGRPASDGGFVVATGSAELAARDRPTC